MTLALRERRPQDARRAAAGEVLIAGAGSIGRMHARSLLAVDPGRRLRFLRSGHGGALDAELGSLPVDLDLDAALARAPAAVVVAVPTALHVPLATRALRAGCHVLLEKPVSHTLDGLDELRAAERAGPGRVLVGFQWRFHPGLRAVRRWLARGLIGEVVHARAYWGEWLPGWHPGEDYRGGYAARADLGGGVLLTLCHPFDDLRFLLGEVESASAECARRSGLDLDVEDTALVTLRLRSGALAAVALDYARRPPAHALRVTGTHGVIAWDATSGVARLRRVDGTRRLAAPPSGFTRAHLFRAQARHFLECVEGRARPACGLDAGIAALKVALAAHRSARTGRRVGLDEVRA
jgi:predicted dehydrogenase